MYEELRVTKAKVFAVLFLFLGHPFVAGAVAIAASTMPAVWWMGSCPLGHFLCFQNCAVWSPLSLPTLVSAAASTCGRGPVLICGTDVFHFESHDFALLAACNCKQAKAELRSFSAISVPGVLTPGSLCLQNRSQWLTTWLLTDPLRHCPSLTLLHCNQTLFLMSYRPGC